MIKVSIIVPCYNAEKYLKQCLDSLVNQTLKEIEIICINDGSTDNTLDILNKYAKQDKRIKLIDRENKGLEATRNEGIREATGEYLAFIDSDDWIDLDFYKKMYITAQKKKADLVRSCVLHHFPNRTESSYFNKTLIRKKKRSLGINDHAVVVWDAIYKTSLIKNNKIYFMEEVKTGHEDVLWTAKITFYATRVYSCPTVFYHYRCTEKDTRGSDVDSISVINTKTIDFINSVQYPTKEDYLGAIGRCFWRYKYCFNTNYTNAKFSPKGRIKFLKLWVKDWINLKEKETIYDKHIPSILSKEDWFELSEEELFDKLCKIYVCPCIISLTSYPARIPTVHKTIETLLNQTVKADKIILWLAEEQFPNKEKDLPQELLNLTSLGLTIDWCTDIRSYKKLIPTLKKYPDAIIVTADDDILYSENWLDGLLKSYVQNPNMIHAYRAREVLFSKTGNVLPYNLWNKHISHNAPSFNNFFTGCGGVLYPPRSLFSDILNEKDFMKISPYGDDIWFWGMAVLNNTKINVVDIKQQPYQFFDASDETLCMVNMGKGLNDLQLLSLFQKYPQILIKLDAKDTNNFSKTKINVFGLPLLKIKQTGSKIKYYFCGIPFMTQKKKKHTVYKVLGIPVMKIKKSGRK